MELIPPNKNIEEMTKTILRQNQLILEMNARLLSQFGDPTIVRANPGYTNAGSDGGDGNRLREASQ